MIADLSYKMDLWIEKEYNVILEGKHGVGKTELIKKKFNEHHLNWLYFSAATMDPWVDFIGIPREKTENGIEFTELVRPKYLAEDSVDAIFLDEYNRAPKKIRNATMELIQFKSINGKKFNRLKFIWVAINPDTEENEYDVEKLDEAQKDRFQIYYRIPYEVSNEYFQNKYGEKGIIATKWWNQLEDAKKNLISPRRLDYCVDYYNSNGDLGDVCDPSINVNSLVVQLDDGLYRDKLISVFNSKDDVAAKQLFKSENFYNAVINIILKDVNLIEYFIDKLPKEKTIINIMNNHTFAVIASTNLPYNDYKDSINILIANAKIDNRIQKVLESWKDKSILPEYIERLKNYDINSTDFYNTLLIIIENIQHTDSALRKVILNCIKTKLSTGEKVDTVNASAIVVYLIISKSPPVHNEYCSVFKSLNIDNMYYIENKCEMIILSLKNYRHIDIKKEINTLIK